MQVRKLEKADSELVCRWLTAPENSQWFDFGGAAPQPQDVRVLLARSSTVARIFTADDSSEPIGVVALIGIHSTFKTAMLLAALGDKRHGRQGYTVQALYEIMREGFDMLGLNSIYAWIAATNKYSLGMAGKLGFTKMGTQRACHVVDGKTVDRVWFDILPDELRNPKLAVTASLELGVS